MDWGAGHLTIIVGTGGRAFANKNCPQSRTLFSNARGMLGDLPGGGGMLAAGIDSHINRELHQLRLIGKAEILNNFGLSGF